MRTHDPQRKWNLVRERMWSDAGSTREFRSVTQFIAAEKPAEGHGRILSIALQLVHGATEGPPGGMGPAFPTGDLPGLADDDTRGLDRLFPRPGIRG